jgi:hypothetical protein
MKNKVSFFFAFVLTYFKVNYNSKFFSEYGTLFDESLETKSSFQYFLKNSFDKNLHILRKK